MNSGSRNRSKPTRGQPSAQHSHREALSPDAPLTADDVQESRNATIHPKRSKRGRYTSIACKECKEKKLKCVPVDDSHCARCVANGLLCVYRHKGLRSSQSRNISSLDNEANANTTEDVQLSSLSNEVTTLRYELSVLSRTISTFIEKTTTPTLQSSELSLSHESNPTQCHRPSSSAAQHVPLIQSPTRSEDADVGHSGQFIGPTRPAYAFHVGEGSLTRMGIPVNQSLPSSRSLSPTCDFSPSDAQTPAQYWSRTADAEIDRLIKLWRAEVGVVYPFLDVSDTPKLHHILQQLQSQTIHCYPEKEEQPNSTSRSENALDTSLTQVMMASALVLDFNGKNTLATLMVESVRSSFFLDHYSLPVTLKRVQLLVSLSIYYFHADEELSSWRMIGLAARDALELGLHRRQSILENFKNDDTRELATRTFWCLYVLDRRWSFGTGLSFAIVDRDVDPELPEPGPNYSYLKSMVGYGRLCSKIWEAIPPFEPSLHPIRDTLVDQLDLELQEWYHSVPFNLQLCHPRLGMASPSQPPDLQRLRTMLYLRGNHARCLLYRHYLLSPTTISRNLKRAWLVVHIAEDSIEVLTHLRSTTELYARQPHAFHYFLLSAMAIVFLVVCHAPAIFTKHCRTKFFEATELIKTFSHQSLACKRLWKTIRSLLCRLKSLGLQASTDETVPAQPSSMALAGVSTTMHTSKRQKIGWQVPNLQQSSGEIMFSQNNTANASILDSYNTPHLSTDDSEIGQDFMSVFDALGQGYFHVQTEDGDIDMENYAAGLDFVTDMGGDILKQFQGFA